MTNRTKQFKKIIKRYNQKLFREGLTEVDNIKLSFAEARLQERQHCLKEELKFLNKLRKILNEYHSEIPMVEIGRQNVLNDIDNELELDKRIKQIKSELKEDAKS